MYNNDFTELIKRCRTNYQYEDNFIIGSGNPGSIILFIGKEPTGNAYGTNTLKHYEENIKNRLLDSWTRYRLQEVEEQGVEPSYWRNPQTLWSRYQALVDYIFPENICNRKEIFDFEERVFCSEMNGEPSKHTKDANRERITDRRIFFQDAFFNRFSVVVLACGDYIHNDSTNPEEREIDTLFGVSFDKEYKEGHNKFWTHFNSDKTRLVIHTRNLSNGISNNMLKKMGDVIRTFLYSV